MAKKKKIKAQPGSAYIIQPPDPNEERHTLAVLRSVAGDRPDRQARQPDRRRDRHPANLG